MENVFKAMTSFVTGLTGVIMGLLTLGIVSTFLFGNLGFFGYDVVQNIKDVLDVVTGGDGVLGLIVLLIVWSLISSK